jgi:hypothetical protein
METSAVAPWPATSSSAGHPLSAACVSVGTRKPLGFPVARRRKVVTWIIDWPSAL